MSGRTRLSSRDRTESPEAPQPAENPARLIGAPHPEIHNADRGRCLATPMAGRAVQPRGCVLVRAGAGQDCRARARSIPCRIGGISRPSPAGTRREPTKVAVQGGAQGHASPPRALPGRRPAPASHRAFPPRAGGSGGAVSVHDGAALYSARFEWEPGGGSGEPGALREPLASSATLEPRPRPRDRLAPRPHEPCAPLARTFASCPRLARASARAHVRFVPPARPSLRPGARSLRAPGSPEPPPGYSATGSGVWPSRSGSSGSQMSRISMPPSANATESA